MDNRHSHLFQAISKSMHVAASSFKLLGQTGDSTHLCLVSTAASKQTSLGSLKWIFIESVYGQVRHQESVEIFHTYQMWFVNLERLLLIANDWLGQYELELKTKDWIKDF